MFQPNAYVVYGRSGVCLVEGVTQVNGQNYYCLRTLHNNCYIQTPVNGIIPIRSVISKEEAEAIIAHIPSIQVKPVNCSSTREMNALYRASVSSQNCLDLIKLTMSIYAKKRDMQKVKKKLTGFEAVCMKECEGRLFGELSIALSIPFDEVQSYIRNRLSASDIKSD